jgi:hypothetical protein
MRNLKFPPAQAETAVIPLAIAMIRIVRAAFCIIDIHLLRHPERIA